MAKEATPPATKPVPKRIKPTPAPGVVHPQSQTRVADLMDEVDLGSIRPNSEADRQRMADRAAGRRPAPTPDLREGAVALAAAVGAVADAESLAVGGTYQVPLHLLQDSPFNARVYYAAEEVDQIAVSLQSNGQDVAVSAFVEAGKVTIIDGSKRLRGARAAGLDSLRVEIKTKPESPKEMYKASRRMNKERSPQTPLDDAVRFKALMDAREYADQESLAADMGTSQTTVSQTLSLNKIPASVLRLMREEKVQDKLCQLTFATEIARMFDGTGTQGPAVEDKAIDVIREIMAKDLSAKQTKELVAARIEGPKARAKAETTAVRYGSGLGTLKVFSAKGQLDLTIKGVETTKIEDLRKKIEALFAGAGEA